MREGGDSAGPGRSLLRRLPPGAWIGLALAAAALLLPWAAILDWGAARFNTVRNFRGDYERGVGWLRGALAVNAALAFAWPWLLRILWPPAGPPVARPHDRRDLHAMLGLFAFALALRLVGVTRSLQHDEWYIVHNYVQHGPLIIVTRYTGFTNHILYTLMAWAGTKLFGMNEFGLRAGSVFFGALAPVALYGALRCRFPRPWSLAGGLALSLSALALEYSQEARAYSVTLFGVAALLWLYEELRDRPTHAVLAGVVVVSTALVYTRMFNVLVVASFVAAVAVEWVARRGGESALLRRTLVAFLACGLLSFLLYAITLGTFLEVQKTGRPEPGEIQGYDSKDMLLPGDLSVAFLPWGFVVAVWGLSVAGWPALLACHRPWFFLLAVMAAGTVWRVGIPWDSSRFWMHLLVPLVAAQVAAVAWLAGRGRWAPRAAAALAVGLVAVQGVSAARYHSQRKLDFKGAAAFLAQRPETERVGYAHDSKTVAWYLNQPARCAEVNAKNLDVVDPEWISVHTATLAGEGLFANRVYRRYRQAWTQKTMYGRSLTLWQRVEPPPPGE